jgi:hypothetical protein
LAQKEGPGDGSLGPIAGQVRRCGVSAHCSLPLPCPVPSLTSGILRVSSLLTTLLRSFPLLAPSALVLLLPIISELARSLFRNVSSHHPIPVPNEDPHQFFVSLALACPTAICSCSVVFLQLVPCIGLWSR